MTAIARKSCLCDDFRLTLLIQIKRLFLFEQSFYFISLADHHLILE